MQGVPLLACPEVPVHGCLLRSRPWHPLLDRDSRAWSTPRQDDTPRLCILEPPPGVFAPWPNTAFPTHAKPEASRQEPGAAGRQRRPAAVGQPEVLARPAGNGAGAVARRRPRPATSWCGPIAYKADEQHGFIGSQKEGMEVFRRHRPEGPADRGRSRLAILAPRAGGPAGPSRAAADRGQLVGHLAGTGRHAQSQRLADQGRPQVLDSVERGFHRQPSFATTWHAGSRRASIKHKTDHVTRVEERQAPARPNAAWARPWPTQLRAREGHHGRLRRRLHGHVQRHHSRRPAATHRRLQGAAQPVGPVLRNHAGRPTTKPAPCAAGWNRAA